MPKGIKLCACGAGNATRSTNCSKCGADFSANKPARKASTAIAAPPVMVDRPAAMRALGDGLVENARRAVVMLGAVIEDQLEDSTPLIDAAFASVRESVELLAAGYHAAT